VRVDEQVQRAWLQAVGWNCRGKSAVGEVGAQLIADIWPIQTNRAVGQLGASV
jgi:hypothetical protein